MVRFSTDHPKVVAAIVAVATLALAALIPRVRVDTDPENMLSADDPVRVFHDRMKREFAVYDMIAVGIVNEGDPDGVFNPDSLRKVYELAEFAMTLRGKGLEAGSVPEPPAPPWAAGGDNPFVPNSQWRMLLGYSRDLPQVASDFTVGAQYYLELMKDYGAYRRALPAGTPAANEWRHTLTLRLTKLLMNQDLRLDLFTFYGLSDDEVYLRPYFSYKITDRWQVDGGANVFFGDQRRAQFAPFERNTNVYAGLRYSF